MRELDIGNLQAIGCSRKAGEPERPDATPAYYLVSRRTAANFNHTQVGGSKDCLNGVTGDVGTPAGQGAIRRECNRIARPSRPLGRARYAFGGEALRGDRLLDSPLWAGYLAEQPCPCQYLT